MQRHGGGRGDGRIGSPPHRSNRRKAARGTSDSRRPRPPHRDRGGHRPRRRLRGAVRPAHRPPGA
ncbi:hypothetical protein SBRY_10309 [Actinacidiphila bryophytorum]|uniref:Uncharacterized protein n=1 Tax=Actinacidiphila bryophytorum TaxID=1436133 RepID=A0A9W4DYJ2_9ACTN|nr:hypothetical protein SBRY_10309 [Actinacidiphila bryophytorum]